MTKQQIKKREQFIKFCFKAHPELHSISYSSDSTKHCWALNGVDIWYLPESEEMEDRHKGFLIETNLTETVVNSILPFLKRFPKENCSYNRKQLLPLGENK